MDDCVSNNSGLEENKDYTVKDGAMSFDDSTKDSLVYSCDFKTD